MKLKRRETITVNVGGICMGSEYPVRVQTMTNTDTTDINASVEQCLRCAEAGAQYVRLTAQAVRHAQCIGEIRQQLRSRGCNVPLIADIHFNPKAAMEAATCCDAVRINPGNFVDPARTFQSLEYTDEEYAAELQRIREALLPFIATCREHGTAVRLGVNHGSLSDRIMSRYGNTAAGMVESVMEFLRVFVAENFLQVVISMKASNVVVMIEAVHRLVEAMDAENMHFPLHLGVTEAGFGEDGRIKSAVGIGTLLREGLGDTIRVSLSEDPEYEIPVAQKLVAYATPTKAPRADCEPLSVTQPIVVASCAPQDIPADAPQPDYYFSQDGTGDGEHRFIVPAEVWTGAKNTFPLVTLDALNNLSEILKNLRPQESSKEGILKNPMHPLNLRVRDLREEKCFVLLPVGETRDIVLPEGCLPLLHCRYESADNEMMQIMAGTDFGSALLTPCGAQRQTAGIWIESLRKPSDDSVLAFAILQACRLRTTSVEFISCPGCGRTLFDLQTTARRVKDATAHLRGVKIAVMGCIVNGPGEMADADYGYVGSTPGRINLYRGKVCVEKNIPESEAINHLLDLIHHDNP